MRRSRNNQHLKESALPDRSSMDPPSGFRFNAALAARYLKSSGTDREKARGKKIDHILSTAVSIFASDGLAGMSTRRIAAEAGVTLSTVQHYFGNRANLVSLTINALLAKYVADYTDLSRDLSRPALDRITQVLDELLGIVDTPIFPAFYAHIWAAAAQDAAIRENVRESYVRYYEFLTTLISQLRSDWPLERSSTLALAIGSQIDGLLMTRMIEPHTLGRWADTAAALKEFWLSTLRAR